MLELNIPETELSYIDGHDSAGKPLIRLKTFPACTISLEHSLVSVSKWEAKFHKPFIESSKVIEGVQKGLTAEELKYYIKCMTITQNVKDDVYDRLSRDNWETIKKYIDDPMSATEFYDNRKGLNSDGTKNRSSNKKPLTTEVIYYMMFSNNIPKECEKWHLNRLMNLLGVFGTTNNPEKMSKKETQDYFMKMNARNRAKYHSKG